MPLVLVTDRTDRRNIRRIEKFEDKFEHDIDVKQEKLVHTLELVASNLTTTPVNNTESGRSSRSKFFLKDNLKKENN